MPNACYIGFTGTPLMNRDRATAEQFGGLIHTYTIDDAVADKAVVPLLYEGRHALQEVNKEAIDKWFDRVCELEDDGWIQFDGKFLRLTPAGWLLANSVTEELLWPTLLSTSEATP